MPVNGIQDAAYPFGPGLQRMRGHFPKHRSEHQAFTGEGPISGHHVLG
jgi:hypothetical protein